MSHKFLSLWLSKNLQETCGESKCVTYRCSLSYARFKILMCSTNFDWFKFTEITLLQIPWLPIERGGEKGCRLLCGGGEGMQGKKRKFGLDVQPLVCIYYCCCLRLEETFSRVIPYVQLKQFHLLWLFFFRMQFLHVLKSICNRKSAFLALMHSCWCVSLSVHLHASILWVTENMDTPRESQVYPISRAGTKFVLRQTRSSTKVRGMCSPFGLNVLINTKWAKSELFK
jgi:hypothetical protein